MTKPFRFLLVICALLAGACQSGQGPAAPVTPPGTDVSTEVWTVGQNDQGQLGRTAADMDIALSPASGLRANTLLTRVSAVAAGSRHSLALQADGSVIAWGSNENGQLGDGTRVARPLPVPVSAPDGAKGRLANVKAVAANGNFSMALRRDRTVVTWGSSGMSQRGLGNAKLSATPTTVLDPTGSRPLTGVAAIAAGSHTELALLTDGSLLAWGANWSGVVGDGTTRTRRLPTVVRGPDGTRPLTGVVQVAIGRRHMLVLLSNGKVLTWGRNETGQLGDGTRKDRKTPVPVRAADGSELGDVASVAAGSKHNFALRRDGTLVAWGGNDVGQLGDGTTHAALYPVPVVGSFGPVLRSIEKIFAGPGYGIAIDSVGNALTWGSAGRGQLGSGNRLPRGRPGPVVFAGGAQSKRVVSAATGDRHFILMMRPG